MKATGIVRRIDDLGRVVIPKEIRRTQLIRVGDPLEIFVTAEGDVVFRKYSPMGELAAVAERYVTALHRAAGVSVAVADRERVVAAAGAARAALGRPVSAALSEAMESRRPLCADGAVALCEGTELSCCAAFPVLCHGDLIGSVALVSPSTEAARAHASVAAAFFAAHLEE